MINAELSHSQPESSSSTKVQARIADRQVATRGRNGAQIVLGLDRRIPRRTLTGLRRDIRSFFGSNADVCRRADDLLFRAGDADAVDDAWGRSAVGKLLPNAPFDHRTALEALDPLLRVYDGRARADLGENEGANPVELHRHSGEVSYRTFPDFTPTRTRPSYAASS